MIRYLALMAAVMSLLGPPAAHAQNMAQEIAGFDNPEFQTFLESDFMERMRRSAIQRSLTLYQIDCLEPPQFQVTDTWPISMVTMTEGALTPTTGVWRERLSSTACEETQTENMVHTFTNEGQRTFLLARGSTEADLATQLALVGEARDAAATHDNARGCDIIHFTDTAVSTRYSDTRWMERWKADACGSPVRLDITFSSEAGLGQTGSETTFSIRVVN